MSQHHEAEAPTLRWQRPGASPAWDDSGICPRLDDDRVGTLVAGRYHLQRCLGFGSSGVVYAAADLRCDRRVAVKLLHPRLRASHEHVARFRREARVAASLRHPSIVEVLEVGTQHDGSLFLVMELLSGRVLLEAIDDDQLMLADVVSIGDQLLDALAVAHEAGVVHRDVKPENVVVGLEAPGGPRVKLFDFGIARFLDLEARQTFKSREGVILGTPHYMSPEACRGEKVGVDGDLWAVGALLFHALAGTPPFDDDHVGRLLLKIVNGRAPRLAELRPDVPRSIRRAVDRALAPDPRKRWRTARAFQAALAR